MKNIWFVIPAYNEEDVIEDTAKKLLEQRENLVNSGKITPDSKILVVDDGSNDNTWGVIEKIHNEDSSLKGLKLAQNSGQQNALFAGYEFANGKCDAVISLDADLQDDISVLEKIIEKYETSDYELVVVTHNDRKTDTFLKSLTANAFYNVMRFLGANIVKNHSEYRLMDRDVIERLLQYKESNLFLRGLVLKLTNKVCVIETERKERALGYAKYNFFSSLNLALDGITSLSVKPMRIVLLTGLLVMLFSFLAGDVELFSIWFLGGLQIFFIGLIGEYIAKINIETKNRPKYIVEKEI